MADQSRFCALFESALQSYEKNAGLNLAEHPLALQLQSCHSIESIIAILQGQAQACSESRGSDRVVETIKSTVSVLTRLSATASLAVDIDLPFPPVKRIHAGLAILLAAAKDVPSSYDALVDLLESIEHFLNRVDIYIRISPTPAMDEMVVKIMAELFSMLALATRELNHGRSLKFVKKGYGEKGIEAILQRLDRLTQDEARTAAAETLGVVYNLVQNMTEVMNDGRVSVDGVREALELLHKMASDKNKSKRDGLQRKIQRWLSPPDPWKNYNIANESRHDGTGAWFVQGDTVSKWKASGPNSLLWIHGKPGAGKSVLCSTIIQEVEVMRKSGLASLAFYYHDFREDQKKHLRGLLSSMLFQLCAQSDSYHGILSNFYSTHLHGAQSPSSDELSRCLKELLELPGQAPVYLIIDALDECPNTSAIPSPREEILTLLEQLIGSRLTDLRLCVTSRPEIDIKIVLEPLTFRSISVHDEKGQIDDMENYIKSVVNTGAQFRRWKRGDKELVIDILTKRADGMFRWVYCQLVYLRGCHPGSIRRALAELPDTLDETYERTLQEINKADWELAHRLFQCVAVASRPFRVEELAEFLAFDFHAGHIPQFREDWRLEDPVEAVLSACSTLLSVVPVEDSTVIQFSHFSVKEFLTSTRFAEKRDAISRLYCVSITAAHTLVTQACLGILVYLDKNITRDSLTKFPLAKYAALHWARHARFEGVSRCAEEGIKRLFDPSKSHLAIWSWITQLGPRFKSTPRLAPSSLGTPLHYAAACGLHTIVKSLAIEHPQHVHSLCSCGNATPLHLASGEGYLEVARVLIEHGGDVKAQDGSGSTPLHYASRNGHVEVARLLIRHGADVTMRTTDGLTPLNNALETVYYLFAWALIGHSGGDPPQGKEGLSLHFASSNERMELAQLLVEHGADIKGPSGGNGWTPLHSASLGGTVQLARFLVEHGADVTAQDMYGATPLHEASLGGNEELVQFLVERGADVTAKDKKGQTLLHRAAHSHRENVDLARFLVEYGNDVTARDESGSTPLHRASFNGHVKFSRFLVDHGADVTAQDKDGSTPLYNASFGGNVELVQFLIERGADVTAKGEKGQTLLHQAAQSPKDNPDLARLLVEHGADVTAQDEDGSTPLHRASYNGHVKFSRFLIDHGADVTAQDKYGSTPLYNASIGGNVELVQFLIERGADVAAKGKKGRTLLHQAAQSHKDNTDLARFLVEHGADVTAQDEDGSTPLHQASYNGNLDFVGFLVERGADVTAQDKDGSTPLHAASRSSRCNVNLVQFLIEHGASVAAQDKHGSTPLDLALSGGHGALAQFLLEHGAADAAPQPALQIQ